MLGNVYCFFYASKAKTVFVQDENGQWSCESVTYDIPFSRHEKHVPFDRLVQVDVNQSSLGRIFNSGTIAVKMVTFVSTEVCEKTWHIPAIVRPYKCAGALRSTSSGHEGVQVILTHPGQESAA